MYYSGIWFGMIQFIICGILNYYSSLLLVKSSKKCNKYTYMDLAYEACGKKMLYFVKINYFINNWAFIIAYIVLQNKLMAGSISYFMGNKAPYFLRDPEGKFWATMIMVFIGFPLSIFRQFSSLRYVCLVGVFFLFYICVVLCIEPFTGRYGEISEMFSTMETFNLKGLFKTFPTAIFAFTCQNVINDI